MGIRWRKIAKRLECPTDEDGDYENDRWTNRDLIPIPPDRRTYTVYSFAIYWFVSGACISAYSTGSSLLAYGLTAQQSMACVVVGAIITGLLSCVCGIAGEVHHIGYTVLARSHWGMKGAYFPVCLRVFTTVWWFGIQAYWGAQAVNLVLEMIGALSPSWKHQPSKFPASAHITHQEFLGLVLWYACYIPLVLVPPERLQRPFIISSAAFACTLIGLLAWSVHTAGGGGPLFHTVNTADSTPFSMMLGITSILSAWGGGTIGQSDWVRYSKRRYYPLLSQLFAAPVMITCCALTGVVVTSASSKILGEVIWSPILLLSAIQDYYNSSSGVRAAVFFAGMGCAMAQLSINVILNSVSCGMDMAGLAPKYLNIRRGAYVLAALGIASNPWQILASASVFLKVISGLGITTAPKTGIMLCDYLLIRRRRLRIEHLYLGTPESVYWYWHGFHWRAFAAFFLTLWLFLPGFLISLINPKVANNWTKIFNITFLIGVALSFTVYAGLCFIFPPKNRFEGQNFLDDQIFTKSVRGAPRSEKEQGVEEEGGEEQSLGKDEAAAVKVAELPVARDVQVA